MMEEVDMIRQDWGSEAVWALAAYFIVSAIFGGLLTSLVILPFLRWIGAW